MRRSVVLGMVGAGCLLLGGCSPPYLPLAAVSLDADGAPVIILRPCGDDEAHDLSLTESGSRKGTDTYWSASGAWAGDVTFPLFSPPPSRTTHREGPQRLVAGAEYALHAPVGDKTHNDYFIWLSFSTGDVRRLKPGQVFADDRAMSRDAFDDLVDDAC
ncbi:hypothetical protein ACFY93_33545 [Streptomyces sp. NPDC008313]|uniref:hypothetical protein n=1 Tax=Streptomyces sp. NPDC008313 TaxID=3364826 RepID=UPI0036E173AF